MITTELKFYKVPEEDAKNPKWIPIVVKNKDMLTGFIEGVNIVSTLYDVDREGVFATLSSERFNDITKDGRRLRDLSETEFVDFARGMIEEGYSRIYAIKADQGSEGLLDEYCLTVQCSCKNFIGFKQYSDIPEQNMKCDLCGNTMIHYTSADDDEFAYDGIPGRNNESLLNIIANLQAERAEQEDEEVDDSEDPDVKGW